MAQYLRDIMTQKPVTVQATDTVVAAARSMRDGNIGDVVVVDNDQIQGILTDRDIVVRALAEGRDPARTTVGEICSRELTTVERNPDSTLGGISAAPPNR
jgi:CBS domain-containing protein